MNRVAERRWKARVFFHRPFRTDLNRGHEPGTLCRANFRCPCRDKGRSDAEMDFLTISFVTTSRQLFLDKPFRPAQGAKKSRREIPPAFAETCFKLPLIKHDGGKSPRRARRRVPATRLWSVPARCLLRRRNRIHWGLERQNRQTGPERTHYYHQR